MNLVSRLDPHERGSNNEGVSYERAGKRVAEWRREHGDMSQVAFANQAGVSVGCLQGLEAGTRATRDVNLDKIAAFMGITRAALLSEEEAPPKVAPDPRTKNLTSEDLYIARLFHEAVTELRASVKIQLRAAADLAQREAAIEGPLFPDVIDRRSGMDRRRPLTAESSIDAVVLGQKLTHVSRDTLLRLSRLDAGAQEEVLAIAENCLRYPEVLVVLRDHIAIFEKRAGLNPAPKTSKSKKKLR
jgi:Helix-turn-helix